jgi:hypothetical protein
MRPTLRPNEVVNRQLDQPRGPICLCCVANARVSLVGQPRGTPADVLGNTAGEREIVGLHLVQWGRSSQGFVPIMTRVQSKAPFPAQVGLAHFPPPAPKPHSCASVITGGNLARRLGGGRYRLQLRGKPRWLWKLYQTAKTVSEDKRRLTQGLKTVSAKLGQSAFFCRS